MQNVRSPLTNSEQVTLIETISSAELIRDWNEKGVDISEELKGHAEIRMYECEQTGLRFFWPLDVAGSSKLYEALQQFPWYYLPKKWEYDVALKTIAACRKAFEVGCGDGAFIAKAIAAGIDIVGIELNPKAVEAAQKRGLPVDLIDLASAADRYAGSADAVCAFQVLEHVTEIRAFIENSLRIVKPGGLLIFCVPNAEGFLRELPSPLDKPPHHMSRWSVKTFASLSQIFPVDLVSTAFEPLSSPQVGAYVASKWSMMRRRFPHFRWLFTRLTRRAVSVIFRLGLRRFASGQALYAVLKKR